MLSAGPFRTILLVAIASFAAAKPVWPHYTVDYEHFEVLSMRAAMPLFPSAAYDVKCLDSNKRIVFHDQNVAQLSICGGMAGSITKCKGQPSITIGHSGSAKFTLKPVNAGAIINISKDKWEQCVRAARTVCPTGSMTGTCSGGTTSGDMKFSLEHS
ncbi:hypothetical protein BKA67DRAFT_530296 [Truncatella angustata]|uniref:Uncharacterized protein n=1 Tax=Truncatella angustata TaxID=152316 RepID=A0A9P8UXX6_9PEZI|nr:uncharacterized protein BKA67DRAFT_530296 [Truncatella angustata]KAH6660180.1 hypothetical protein BKA67DRAFT_530296 [Truncatella angustata]KAH8201023.1 hypothetical protein TruAng_004796 [Truncatella angustata]